MEIRIDIISEEMTEREVAALSRDIGDALFRGRKADSVDPVVASAPESAKGLVSVIGSLLVGLPVEALTGALEIIKAIASRPGHPPVTMKITRDTAEVSFDPRRVTPAEVAKLAKQLRARE
ncbi:hypothetical protein BTHE68_71980 (plasmid) [Burkholderia sp. THE68]|uniref:hypothetical protein n=1 Tax=Burkholderia sp. THE68 TaxID=758782 RepID=UPI0013180D34|nr:hypothetical protein [Burkholderia sp. THE68]BBU33464.1 hypothetical protein BTHE68_71980 [Burkholderia sp. THE68]